MHGRVESDGRLYAYHRIDDDPGRKINLARERYKVYIDGVEVKHVFTADDEKGEVIAAVLDNRGYMTAENGEVKRQSFYGRVIIQRQ